MGLSLALNEDGVQRAVPFGSPSDTPHMLSVVIVNFNGARFLKAALDTILASNLSVPLEVIVVDNASQDASLDILNAYRTRIRLICNSQNTGFAAANNQGVALASGDVVFLLNNDTLTPPDTCARLMQVLCANPTIGAIGPCLQNADGSRQTTGGLLGQWQYRKSEATSVSFLSGAAVMMRRALYLELGGFDEMFFFYNEDLDLCKRIQKAGYLLCFLPTATLTHLGGQSTHFLGQKALIEGYRGGLYFCYKHYGVLSYCVYRTVLIPVTLLLMIFYAMTGWSAARRQQVRSFAYIFHMVLMKGYQK